MDKRIYRASATASGWFKNGRYLKAWRDGAEMRPETLTGYGDTESEAKQVLRRKICARGMAMASQITVAPC